MLTLSIGKLCGLEYTACTINALKSAFVELPLYVDKAGFHPLHLEALPPEGALLIQLSSGIEEKAATAALTGDPVMHYQAICDDLLSVGMLSLAEICSMVNEMFAQNHTYLP